MSLTLQSTYYYNYELSMKHHHFIWVGYDFEQIVLPFDTPANEFSDNIDDAKKSSKSRLLSRLHGCLH